jgi:hypothetical protein
MFRLERAELDFFGLHGPFAIASGERCQWRGQMPGGSWSGPAFRMTDRINALGCFGYGRTSAEDADWLGCDTMRFLKLLFVCTAWVAVIGQLFFDLFLLVLSLIQPRDSWVVFILTILVCINAVMLMAMAMESRWLRRGALIGGPLLLLALIADIVRRAWQPEDNTAERYLLHFVLIGTTLMAIAFLTLRKHLDGSA